MNIAVIGTGYAGLPHAALLAKYHKVYAVDKREEVVEMIKRGVSPINEPGLAELLNNKNLIPTTNLSAAVKDSCASFICVGTPNGDDGEVDLSNVLDVAYGIGNSLRASSAYHVVIVKSTVPPATTRERVMPAVLRASQRSDIGFVMNPEFLREGFAVYDVSNPDRIVVGVSDETAAGFMRTLYSPVYDKGIERTTLEGAEVVKYASNAFLAMKISFANEISNICEKVGYGIDSREVLKLMALDNRINPKFLRPSRGFGGSCFPKDLRAIANHARSNGYEPHLLESVLKVNDNQPKRIIDLLENVVGDDFTDLRVAVLGLSFKAGTDDIRHSCATPIIKTLVERGADVVAYDPQAMDNMRKVFPSQIEYVSNGFNALRNADAALVLTREDEFMNLSLSSEKLVKLMRSPVIIDGESVFSEERFLDDRITYRSIGLANYKKD